MELIKVDEKELPNKYGDFEYDIVNRTYQQIYKFYANNAHSQKNCYLIDTEKNKMDLITSDIGTYAALGIYFPNDDSIGSSRKYILFLSRDDLIDEDTIEAAINRERSAIGCDKFDYCMIEKTYSYADSKEADNEAIRVFFPNIIVFNRGFDVISVVPTSFLRKEGKNYLDAADLFNEYFDKRESTVSNRVNGILTICDKISEMMKTGEYSSVIFDRSRLDKNINNSLYYEIAGCYQAIASYLMMKEGIDFELYSDRAGTGTLSSVLDTMSRFTSRDYNYLEDYLEYIRNPLDAGYVLREGNIYIAVRDHKKYYSAENKYAIRLRGYGVEFDPKNFKFLRNKAEDLHLFAVGLDTVSIKETFGFNGSWDTSISKASQASEVLREFVSILLNKIPLSSTGIPDITNLLIVNSNGKYYLMYVTDIDGGMPYYLLPNDDRYKGFPFDFTYDRLNQIYDLKSAVDGQNIINWLRGRKILSGDCKLELPSHARGMLVSNIRALKTRVDYKNIPLNFEEFCIWYPVTVRYRGRKSVSFLQNFTEDSLLSVGILSFFGGPLTEIVNSFRIRPNSWR